MLKEIAGDHRLAQRGKGRIRLSNCNFRKVYRRHAGSDEQAAYFGLTRAKAVALGKEAKAFTAANLARPFTIQTRWRKVFGPQRYYALVFTVNGEDLCELLVRNGLARIYGTRTPLPDGRTSRQYLARLRELETQAKEERLGGWKMRHKWLARSKPALALTRHDDH